MGLGSFCVLIILIATFIAWYGNNKALRVNHALDKDLKLPSLPKYYSFYAILWLIIPSTILILTWYIAKPLILDAIVLSFISENTITNFPGNTSMLVDRVKSINIEKPFPGTDKNLIEAAVFLKQTLEGIQTFTLLGILSLGCFLSFIAIKKIDPAFRARQVVEKYNVAILLVCSVVAIVTTIGIVFSLIFEALRFFDKIPLFDFLFGLSWSPQMAIREDQVASQGSFGAIPIFAGTLLITIIAMTVAIPVGLTSAIFLSQYASPMTRSIIKPILEILAGVPTVVYGFFAAITVGPFLKGLGDVFSLNIASESALAAGSVMGIMIIPFISSLSDDVMSAVPQNLKDGSYAMGATKSETVKKVILPAALPGIVGAILLAVSRAVGETMIVVMAAGIAANLTANPLEAVTTVTVQIVTLLIGDQEFDSAKTLAAFALGITLFVVTLTLNLFALRIVHKYREKYE